MQTHHLIPLATQLLDYANPSPKLWLTFSLKTNHLVQSSQCDLHSHPDLAVEPDHLFMSLHGLKMKLTIPKIICTMYGMHDLHRTNLPKKDTYSEEDKKFPMLSTYYSLLISYIRQLRWQQ